jgi:ParB-like chromosome segregation protein Spo0J
MRHHITKDFPVGNLSSGYIDCRVLYRYIKSLKINPVNLRVEDIRSKPMRSIKDDDLRYRIADINLPCIVIKEDDHYQLIDGRHRLRKVIKNNYDEIPCFILSQKQVLIGLTSF